MPLNIDLADSSNHFDLNTYLNSGGSPTKESDFTLINLETLSECFKKQKNSINDRRLGRILEVLQKPVENFDDNDIRIIEVFLEWYLVNLDEKSQSLYNDILIFYLSSLIFHKLPVIIKSQTVSQISKINYTISLVVCLRSVQKRGLTTKWDIDKILADLNKLTSNNKQYCKTQIDKSPFKPHEIISRNPIFYYQRPNNIFEQYHSYVVIDSIIKCDIDFLAEPNYTFVFDEYTVEQKERSFKIFCTTLNIKLK
jgi:hypothetical protein